ncbi:carboxypeptidase B [Lucilia cuprina]|uniref:carboxypeptidase B n=1 Tax=Lucilia cuprina TaxID=7375 RepID=UPI001F062432|nr:carboxypeptidase B [Lucilia cuprina]
MLKSQGEFVNPIEDSKVSLNKVFELSSLLPDIKTYQAALNHENSKWPILINNHTRIRSKTCIKLSSPKSKHKRKKTSVSMKLATVTRPDILHSYLSYSEILQYFDYIKIRFMDFVKIHTLGTTFERRSIKCIEINWNNEKAKENRARSAPINYMELKLLEENSPNNGRNIVFIEGGTHAREWLSVTVALNCIYQLTEKNVRHRDLLRKLKFYIVPVVNPDGYEYARNFNPRWRKNRRPTANGDYIGTDCNRNFDFHWDVNRAKAKRNTYQGDKPFSEHETKAVAAILHSLAPGLLFFLSLHSYAQSIMYPWGYSKSLPKNAKLMESVAIAGRNAIKALSGRYYRVGSISHITKRHIAGSVVDYAYGAVKIPLTLVMELPSSEYGFQPPADKIYPLGMESWHGIREMCKKAYSLKTQIEEEEIMNGTKDESSAIETKEDKSEDKTVQKQTKVKNQKLISKQLSNNKSNKLKLNNAKNRLTEGIITSISDVKF